MQSDGDACSCGRCSGFKRHRIRTFLSSCKRCGCGPHSHRSDARPQQSQPGRLSRLLGKHHAKKGRKHSHAVVAEEEVSIAGLGPFFSRLHQPVRSMILASLSPRDLCALLQTSRAFFVVVSSDEVLWRQHVLAAPWVSDSDVSAELGSACCWRGRFVAKSGAEAEQSLALRLRQAACAERMGPDGEHLGFGEFAALRAELRLAEAEMEERLEALVQEHEDDLVALAMWEKCPLLPSTSEQLPDHKAGRRLLDMRSKCEAGPPTIESVKQVRKLFAELNTLERVRECEREAVALFETRPWVQLNALASEQRDLVAAVADLDRRLAAERRQLDDALTQQTQRLSLARPPLEQLEQHLAALRNDPELRALQQQARESGPDPPFLVPIVFAAIATGVYSPRAGVAVLALGILLFIGATVLLRRRESVRCNQRREELGIPTLVTSVAKLTASFEELREAVLTEQRRLVAAHDARTRGDVECRVAQVRLVFKRVFF